MCFSFYALTAIRSTLCYANNIQVSNVTLQNMDATAGTVEIKFDLSWENSFSATDPNGKTFYDRAWVFVKFWKNGWATDGTVAWKHATLIAGTRGESLAAYDSPTGTGIVTGGKGAFCKPGYNQVIKWNFTAAADGIISTDAVQVKVMAIEMCYIPLGVYDLGDGNGSSESLKAFHVTDNTGIGLISGTTQIGTTLISGVKVDAGTYDDDQIELTGIGIDGDGGLDTDNNGAVDNASFPTGYKAFYVMKYELSQGQYRDFLNLLSRAQQNTRTASQAANQFVMSNTTSLTNKNGLRAPASPGTASIAFGCDFNANGVFNEAADGEWIACNYLSWPDVAAYADWAGLRPMTELEFEKACRGGGSTAVYQEWSGGAYASLDYFSDLSNEGKVNETKGPTRANANCNYISAAPNGPARCGLFATGSSSRLQSGASYYGVMELSGNLLERVVTVGNAAGRSFAGTHGDGVLSSSGNAENSDWPGYVTSQVTGSTGSGLRGGDWSHDPTQVRVSDRENAANAGASPRDSDYQGRCARSE